MSFNEKNIDSSIVIEVSGDVDLDKTDDFRNQVFEAFDKEHKVVLDMSQVSYIDSSGISVLIESHQKAQEQGKEFLILKPSEPVTSVIEMAKLDTFFIIEK